MKRHFVLFTFFIFSATILIAQEEEEVEVDSLELPSPTGDLIPIDSLPITLMTLPNDLEYIPADDTPELLADRLSCLQQTIPLTYNNTVHGFINYAIVNTPVPCSEKKISSFHSSNKTLPSTTCQMS
jgi:membrane-bound lytic murein transglycosylase D